MSSTTEPNVSGPARRCGAIRLAFCGAAVALGLAAPAAQAAVGCPPSQDGHPLARLDGASLYQGDPSANMLLAPTHENPGGRGVNVWNLPDPAGIVLVCRYDGSRTPIVISLPADVRACQQSAGAFSCK